MRFGKGAYVAMIACGLLVGPDPGQAEEESTESLVAKGLCSDIVSFINILADFSHTECLPTADGFIFITEQPVLSMESAKKGWLMAVMAGVGYVLNGHPSYKKDANIYTTDAEMLVSKQSYYSVPAQTLKDLQAKVKNDQLDLNGAWKTLSAALKQTQLPARP